MPKENTFMRKMDRIAREVRDKGTLSLGDASILTGVGADWLKRNYIPAITMYEDIFWTGQHFEKKQASVKITQPTHMDSFIKESIIHPLESAHPSVKRAVPQRKGTS